MESLAKIIKVKKNSEGDITDLMLDNGNVYSISDAIEMVKDGAIDGVNIGRAKNGKEFLRTNPNDKKFDNLDNLPIF